MSSQRIISQIKVFEFTGADPRPSLPCSIQKGAIVRRNVYALMAAAMMVGVVASACNGSNSGTQTTGATSATSNSSAATPTGDSTQLPSLIPTPANSQPPNGPSNIPDNGIHMYFQVNGSPNDVMNAYKAALEGKGWSVMTIITSGGGGGGGATYTGTHGDAYGVFDGGGFNSTTYIDVCAWPSKPSNPNCTRGGR
jgi:hypothetical protein